MFFGTRPPTGDVVGQAIRPPTGDVIALGPRPQLDGKSCDGDMIRYVPLMMFEPRPSTSDDITLEPRPQFMRFEVVWRLMWRR